MSEAVAREPIAKPSDLDRVAGERAYTATSFHPERRAQTDIDAYVADVHGLAEELAKIAKTDAQRAIAAEQVERYRRGYVEHQNTLWAAHSRVMSSFITGPANFPVARNEKRLNTYDRRFAEFREWRGRAQAAAFRAVQEARTPEQVFEDEWRMVKKDVAGCISMVRAIDSGLQQGYERRAFVTSAAGRIERLAANGQVDLVRRALDLVREGQKDMPKPIFAARHSVWNAVSVAEKAAARIAETAGRDDETILELLGVKAVNCFGDERVRIFFDDIPPREVREALRGSGWKWSPSNGAWQRQNTEAGIYAAKTVLGKFYGNAARQDEPAPSGA